MTPTPNVEAERELTTAYRMLFESDLGRVVLRDLRERFGPQHKFAVVSNHAQLAYANGQEDVINHIYGALDTTGDDPLGLAPEGADNGSNDPYPT